MASDSPKTHDSNRIALAFLIAPAVAGLPVGLLLALPLPKVAVMAVALISGWAYPAALVFAVPAYFALRKRLAITPRNSALIGAALGVAPASVLLAAAAPQLLNMIYLGGLIGWPAILGLAAICGATSGLAFWRIAMWPDRNPTASG